MPGTITAVKGEETMDRFIRDKLHLNPRSEQELHSVLSNFELKWQNKARRATDDERINRF
jgi:hypothetical protein